MVAERKYRYTLNEQFSALSEVIKRKSTQRIVNGSGVVMSKSTGICRTKPRRHRQKKTEVLSSAIETIRILTERCNNKAKDVSGVQKRLDSVGNVLAGYDRH